MRLLIGGQRGTTAWGGRGGLPREFGEWCGALCVWDGVDLLLVPHNAARSREIRVCGEGST